VSAATELLIAAGLDPVLVRTHVELALAEDVPGGLDITSVATISETHTATLAFVARQSGVVAGIPVAMLVFELVGGTALTIELEVTDGSRVAPGDTILSVSGRTRDLLRAERPALNYLGRLSGIATATHAWVVALAGTNARVRDTRKTTPSMRALEKYAVRCGGGVNHRMSLSDAALIKDNHVAAAGGVVPAFAAVREQFPDVELEVEVDSLDQLEQMLAAGADLILLDNFTVEELTRAVAMTAGRAKLEASGGLTLTDAASVGATGVDFLAVGALTHSSPVLDIGADYRES